MRRLRASGGLATDPSAINNPEALRVATNVALHRPGIIQPRLGFGDTTGIASRGGDYRPFQAIRFGDDVVIGSAELGGSADYKLERLSVAASYTGGDPLPPDKPNTRTLYPHFLSRGSLYIVTSAENTKGIRKIVSPSTTATLRAGLAQSYCPPAPNIISSSAGDDRVAIGAGKCAAYRLVYYRKDANGYEIRSAPGSREVVRAPSGTYANGVRVNLADIAGQGIFLPTETIGGPIAGDTIEVYRTRGVTPDTADPGEEYYLAVTHVITGTEISNGVIVDLLDDVEDEQLGVALYTNPSQLGALASKEVPPMGNDGAWWREVAWIGGTQDRASLQLYITKVADMSTPALAGIGIVGNIEGTANTTINDPTLTSVSLSATEWSALAIGQWISGTSGPGAASGGIPLTARILSFNQGASTITMTVNATANGVATVVKAGDLIDVCGTEFFFYTSESAVLRRIRANNSSNDLATRCYDTAQSASRVIGGSAARGTGRAFSPRDRAVVGGSGDILLISVRPEGVNGDDTITAQCSMRGGAFVPNITTELESPDPYVAGRLSWSSLQEPEAWPPAQNTVIGNANEPIQRLIALDDALLVWKTDGVYKVSGYPPNGWVVDLVSSDLRLFSPESVCEHRGRCYAWTNQGIVEMTSSGQWRVISGPVDDIVRRTEVLSGAIDGRAWQAVSDDRLNRVLFGYDETGETNTAEQWLVWHPGTERWAQYNSQAYGYSYDPGFGRLLRFDAIDAWDAAYERGDEADPFAYYDANLTSLVSSTNGAGDETTIAIAAFGGRVPAAGDVLGASANGRSARVLSVVVDGTDYVITHEQPQGADGWEADIDQWYQSYSCEVQWQAQELPGIGVRWGEAHLRLHDITNFDLLATPITIGGETENGIATVTPSVNAGAPKVVRVGLPRNLIRAARFYPQLTVTMAGTLWVLEALDLHHTETGRRVAR